VKRFVIGSLFVAGVFGGATTWVVMSPSTPPKKKAKPVEIVAVTPLPPPPPPLPPPPEPEKAPEPEPEQLAEEEPVEQAEPEQPGPEEPPDEALGTSITGNGSSDFNLSSKGNGRPGGGGGGGTGSERAAFLRGVSTTLQAELKRHPALKNATYDVVLNVRVSSTGYVVAITPEPSTGDPAIDRVLSHGFIGLLLPQPPPSGKAGVVKTRAKSAKPRA